MEVLIGYDIDNQPLYEYSHRSVVIEDRAQWRRNDGEEHMPKQGILKKDKAATAPAVETKMGTGAPNGGSGVARRKHPPVIHEEEPVKSTTPTNSDKENDTEGERGGFRAFQSRSIPNISFLYSDASTSHQDSIERCVVVTRAPSTSSFGLTIVGDRSPFHVQCVDAGECATSP